MRTQLFICVIVVAILFTCGSIALHRALQLHHTVENERARMVAFYTDITEENQSLASAYMQGRGRWR